jgi:hypothetical protein
MGWNTVAVDAPASQVKIDFNEIPDDVKDGVEEMFKELSSVQRGVVAFADTDSRDLARAQIRAYCEKRKDGRLTASIWAGYTDAKSEGAFRQKASEGDLPALSLSFTVYEKKSKSGQTANS